MHKYEEFGRYSFGIFMNTLIGLIVVVLTLVGVAEASTSENLLEVPGLFLAGILWGVLLSFLWLPPAVVVAVVAGACGGARHVRTLRRAAP